MFTQGVAVLLSEAPPVERVAAALEGRKVLGTLPGDEAPGWMGQRPSLVLALDAETNGKVVVDLVDARWPDPMGDPKQEPELFAAWTMGWFGPFAFPGNLERATGCCLSWNGGRDAIDRHRAFLRVRTSYVLCDEAQAKVLPPDYDPEAELETVTKIAHALCGLPEALAYFNPSGEVLLPRETVGDSLAFAFDHTVPPLELWANVRMFGDGAWTVMDTVGMRQLDLDDHEACFIDGRFAPEQVYSFLRNTTFYVLEKGPVIKDGDTTNGPGGVRWRARVVGDSLGTPPRPTLRWFPLDGSEPPPQLQPAAKAG
jgi:hypothetical protein